MVVIALAIQTLPAMHAVAKKWEFIERFIFEIYCFILPQDISCYIS